MSKEVGVALDFPIGPVSEALFPNYLHRYMFWNQLKIASLDLVTTLFYTARKVASMSPSLSFEEYIDESK